uniref:AlgX/AlgJ SGNH hydrolase-like domain-containing protein n=1 Tax=Alloyangia mangrovi TaxID=1779329 RepID=A0A2A3JQQ4_9RHOB
MAVRIAAQPGLTGSAQFTQVPGAEVRFTGDLVSYVTSGELAPLVGLSAERVTPYEAVSIPSGQEAALDLFGEAGAGEVVDLVGTSYSANPNWSFAEALKLELGRDVINYATEGQGPFVPMRDYLQKRAPETAATTVLWEIPLRYLLDPELPETLAAEAGPEAQSLELAEEGGT